MSWDKRKNGKTYFYRKRRVNGRVVSHYVGRDPLAQLFALGDDDAARAVAQRRFESHLDLAELAEIERTLDELEAHLTWLTQAVLLASGYHTHKGQWRYKRVKTNPTASDRTQKL